MSITKVIGKSEVIGGYPGTVSRGDDMDFRHEKAN